MILNHSLRQDWKRVYEEGEILQAIGERTALTKLRCMGLAGCAVADIHRENLPQATVQLRHAIALAEPFEEHQLVMEWILEVAFPCLEQNMPDEARHWLDKAASAEIDSGILITQAAVGSCTAFAAKRGS